MGHILGLGLPDFLETILGSPDPSMFKRDGGRKPDDEEEEEERTPEQILLDSLGFSAFGEDFTKKAASGQLTSEDQENFINFLALASQGPRTELIGQLTQTLIEADDPLGAVPDLLDIFNKLQDEGAEEEDDLLGFDFEKSLELDLQSRQLSLEQQQKQFIRDGILSIINTFPRNIQAQAMLSFLEQPELRDIFLPSGGDFSGGFGAEPSSGTEAFGGTPFADVANLVGGG